MKNTILTLTFGIFLLVSVSALYGGETTTITFDFEPVACSLTDNLSFDIIGKNVDIDLPINFLGNFTLTCFSGEEADPVIIRRGGGGSRTIYENVTVYEDKIIEVEKSIEVEVPGETIIEEKIIEVKRMLGTNGDILVGCLIFIVMMLLLWNITRPVKQEDNDIVEKGGEKQNE